MTLKAWPSAVHAAQECRSPDRLHEQHARQQPPAGDLPAVRSGTFRQEDTPVYWQTLQAMVSAPRRGG
jgi:hypothetical protein